MFHTRRGFLRVEGGRHNILLALRFLKKKCEKTSFFYRKTYRHERNKMGIIEVVHVYPKITGGRTLVILEQSSPRDFTTRSREVEHALFIESQTVVVS